jgi:S1-C subfamily serine protease
LFVQEAANDRSSQANMSVPVDLLEPVLDDLILHGRAAQPPRPWLGVYVQQRDGDLVVAATADKGPADRAGIEPGDVIEAVAGTPVDDLAELFRQVWAQGPAGTEIAMSVRRDGEPQLARVKSIQREAMLYHARQQD